MIKDIITYPTLTGIEYAPDVRVFNEELSIFIDDLKDTVRVNKLDGLSGPQVGSYYSVVVIKLENGDFLELVNPRILTKKGSINSLESTSYFPNINVEMKRYETINLIYEDKFGKQHSLKADGKLSILLQRKIDYLFGANFLTKLNDKDRDKLKKELNSNLGSCSTNKTIFNKDYFINLSDILTIFMLVIFVISFFIENSKFLLNYQLYLSFSIFLFNIAYIFYSYYENKKFNLCSNCFNINIFSVISVPLVRTTILIILSYIFI